MPKYATKNFKGFINKLTVEAKKKQQSATNLKDRTAKSISRITSQQEKLKLQMFN